MRRVVLSLSIPTLVLITGSALNAQPFTKITDPNNPIAADPGSTNSYAGASWIDYNGDGLLDLFVNRQSTLYKGVGGGNFTRVLLAIPDQGGSFGNTWADVDNDGDPDCFVSGGSGRGSFLYRNDGNDQFVKVRDGAIGDSLTNSGWGSAWGDYDNDGFVDLVIAAPFNFAGILHGNRLLHNNGDGLFTLVDTSIVEDGLEPFTVPAWSDYDLDGDIDMFIGSGPANGSLAPDFLYENNLASSGSATFDRIMTDPIATDPVDGQIWNWIDYDNDGDLDAFLTNYNASVPNNLYRRDGETFERMTEGQVGSIVSDHSLSLTNLWADFDNDGDLDCFVTNDSNPADWYYVNNGDGTFTKIDTLAITASIGAHYGATAGDYDNDGDLDLYVSGTTASKGLYRNDLPAGRHWIRITCTGAGGATGSNLSALGARVRAKATIYGLPVWQMREVSAQNSFNSQNMLDVHFGLGDAGMIDSLEIRWPSGLVEVLTAILPDDRYTATEGSGFVTGIHDSPGTVPERIALGQNYPNPFNPSTTIPFDVHERGHVRLTVYDLIGRQVATVVDGVFDSGSYRVPFSLPGGSSTGVYVYRLSINGTAVSKRMMLLK